MQTFYSSSSERLTTDQKVWGSTPYGCTTYYQWVMKSFDMSRFSSVAYWCP